jgi:hypothetical protein
MSSVSLSNGLTELVVTDPSGVSDTPEQELKYPHLSNHRQIFKSKLATIIRGLL